MFDLSTHHNPVQARLSTLDERRGVIDRIEENKTGFEYKTCKKAQFVETLTDIKTWLLFAFAVDSKTPNGGLTTFQGIIIKGLGFLTLQTVLIQMLSGGVHLVTCCGACYFASRYQNATLAVILICLVPFLAGRIGKHHPPYLNQTCSVNHLFHSDIWPVPHSVPYGHLVCFWISFSYTVTWTLSMSVATANTAGHTKKVTTNAFLLIGYCLGNFIGPFFFVAKQAPRYDLGVGMVFFCIGVQVLSILGIWGVLWKRYKSRKGKNLGERDRLEGYDNGFGDLTDLENVHFRYVY
jgi:ACS family allantoate permease-like MFS transporter